METCSPEEEGEDVETERQTRKQHVFRDPRSEEAAERRHAEKCQRAFDKALGEFTSAKGMTNYSLFYLQILSNRLSPLGFKLLFSSPCLFIGSVTLTSVFCFNCFGGL